MTSDDSDKIEALKTMRSTPKHTSESSTPGSEADPGATAIGGPNSGRTPLGSRVRWTICALVFFATTVNYLDRQIFSLLVPFFEDDLRLGPTDLALINVSFIVPYGLVMLFVGQYIDRVGIKRGLGNMFLLWNVASIGHAFVRGLGSFVGMRFLLGVGESGMFPGAVKTMAEWFPVRERALATGIFNAGANFGAILAPLLGVALAARFGWRACFVLTGSVGLVWILFWNRTYKPPAENPRVSQSELAYIRSDGAPQEEPISYSRLFGLRPLYGIGIAKALTDAPWWFYLTWMPKLLVDQFHVSAGFMALAIPAVYVIADVGSVAGGWMSSALIQRGFAVGPARKLTMLACAVAVVPVASVGFLVDHPAIAGVSAVYWAIGVLSLAAGAHQGWSCNLFTLVSDTVPEGAVAMAVGAVNGFAMVGVSAMQFFVGSTVQLTSSYTAPFVVSASLYLIALLIIQLMVPRIEPHVANRAAKIPLVFAAAVVILAGLGVMQYELNKPPYSSLSDYSTLRSSEIHASSGPQAGPAAKVGWMSAQWYRWRLADGKDKIELVKFDTAGHPYIESKGAAAAKYDGPSKPEVVAAFGGS